MFPVVWPSFSHRQFMLIWGGETVLCLLTAKEDILSSHIFTHGLRNCGCLEEDGTCDNGARDFASGSLTEERCQSPDSLLIQQSACRPVETLSLSVFSTKLQLLGLGRGNHLSVCPHLGTLCQLRQTFKHCAFEVDFPVAWLIGNTLGITNFPLKTLFKTGDEYKSNKFISLQLRITPSLLPHFQRPGKLRYWVCGGWGEQTVQNSQSQIKTATYFLEDGPFST